jgi:hypothetical protein
MSGPSFFPHYLFFFVPRSGHQTCYWSTPLWRVTPSFDTFFLSFIIIERDGVFEIQLGRGQNRGRAAVACHSVASPCCDHHEKKCILGYRPWKLVRIVISINDNQQQQRRQPTTKNDMIQVLFCVWHLVFCVVPTVTRRIVGVFHPRTIGANRNPCTRSTMMPGSSPGQSTSSKRRPHQPRAISSCRINIDIMSIQGRYQATDGCCRRLIGQGVPRRRPVDHYYVLRRSFPVAI